MKKKIEKEIKDNFKNDFNQILNVLKDAGYKNFRLETPKK